MSLALIQECAKEVRRLAIAGSPLAVGDFRLKKLAAPLEQSGAKVPVFAQVAKAINEVVNGKEADSAANLLNLSTLLNAILYTQGQSSVEGDLSELETFESNCVTTRTPARLLKPLVQALTRTGSGRFETVKSAVERGAFNDLRLVDPAIQALGDVYPELADLVAEKILPGYGPGIVPLLKSGFDLKGKKTDARRLQIMHQLDPTGTLPLCKTALEEGSPEVKVAAIVCLGKHEECLPLLLEQANAKNKQLRVAALEALAAHDRPDVARLFIELVNGEALDLLVGPLRGVRSLQVLNALLDDGKRVFGLMLKGDAEQIQRGVDLLQCLEHRTEEAVQGFLLTVWESCDKITKLKPAKNSNADGESLVFRLANLLYACGSPRTLDAVLAKRKVLPIATFPQVLGCALRRWSPETIFDEFSSLLGEKRGAGKVKREELQSAILTTYEAGWLELEGGEESNRRPASECAPLKVPFDARWLDAAIKADALELVCALARPNHKGVIPYLLKAAQAKNPTELEEVVEALARCGYAKVTELFLEHATRLAKKNTAYNYELFGLFRCAAVLPPTDLPALDAFAAQLDEKYVDHFLEAIAPLRSTHPLTEA